jgi:uncharacterized 2Fe-2S/4Fe-4S cluster protein (DUF4445 family)
VAHRVPVVFEPASVTAWVTPGTTVAAAARVAGVLIAIPCGGRGVCGSCGVRVVAGELDAADPVELAGLKRAPQGVRLACRATVSQAVTVRPIVAQRATAPGRPLIPGVPLVAGVDLGTTSVAAMIVEAETGRELGRASVPNEQQSFGADVLSRISASLDGERASLQEAAEASIDEAIRASSGAAEASASSVQRVVIAGNTAMVALLAGVDAEPLSHHPFDVPFAGRKLPDGTAPRLGLRPECQIELVPPLAAFVGGDALAGALAAGLVEAGRPQLLLDLGTNAEIVLARSGELTVASTAAGPAFEGVVRRTGRFRCGRERRGHGQ